VAIKRLSKKSKKVDSKLEEANIENNPSEDEISSTNAENPSDEKPISDTTVNDAVVEETPSSTESEPIENEANTESTTNETSLPSTDEPTDPETNVGSNEPSEEPSIDEVSSSTDAEPIEPEDNLPNDEESASLEKDEQIETTEDFNETSSDESLDSSSTDAEASEPADDEKPLDEPKDDSFSDIPPLPAEDIEEPEIIWEPKTKEDSERLREIDRLANEEIDAIDAEITALEEQIIKEELEISETEFVPETEEEKLEFEKITKMEEEAKEVRAEVEEMKKEIPPRVEKHDSIEVYVPEFAKDDLDSDNDQTDDSDDADEEDEEIEESEPAVDEDPSVQEEIDKAYESGVSGELDEWDRTILLPIFENRLRMSKNSLKYAYSKIKNTIMSYVDVTASFQGALENFRYNRKIILRFAIHKNTLQLYCALPVDSLDTNVYPHKKSKGDHAKATPIVVDINSDESVKNAIEIIAVVMAKFSTIQREQFVPTAYAERYPLNPNAVLLGKEHIEPVLGQYDNDFDYAPISGEIVNGIIETKFTKEQIEAKKELKGKEVLDDLRQTATTIKAAVALSEPVVYFFDPAVARDSNVDYIGIQQVLNDKFLGRLIPQMFFAVAEGSDRIEKFNFLALEEAVKQCNSYPEHRFALAVSCRLLIRDAVFERLVKSAKTERENLILCFDCALLEALGNLGLERIRRLRNEAGVMIMIDNSENAGMKVLTEYDIEYIRFDGRFYLGDKPRQRAHLEMMTGYAKSQNIKTTSINVASFKEAQHMIERGVDVIQGTAAGDPKRVITLALKSARKMPIVR